MKKYVKKFESYIDGIEDSELFADVYNENPLKDTHDFYIFIYNTEGFKEVEGGLYKKTFDIEKMVKLDPSISTNVGDMIGIEMRAKITAQRVGVIWWPKGGEDMIEDKSSKDMDLYVLDLIEKHMSKYDIQHGKEVFKKIVDKNKEIGKSRIKVNKEIDNYNL